jgi:phosphoribosylformimino-5-aminoimidazole carboxamide ribotide isomerase
MILYPAIDMRGGRVVRLREGDPNRQTVYSDDPFATAQRWIDAGTSWLHVVNLDGAFAVATDNGAILSRIAALGAKVQFGGGLRSEADLELAMSRGASRLVLGTVAVQNPELVRTAVARYGADAVCVALDARDGFVTTHGWQEKTSIHIHDLGRDMASMGVKHCLFTDVSLDGGLQGVNRNGTIELAKATGLSVIASGGVNSLDDLRALHESGVVAGAVIGMALYEGRIELSEALKLFGGEVC